MTDSEPEPSTLLLRYYKAYTRTLRVGGIVGDLLSKKPSFLPTLDTQGSRSGFHVSIVI